MEAHYCQLDHPVPSYLHHQISGVNVGPCLTRLLSVQLLEQGEFSSYLGLLMQDGECESETTILFGDFLAVKN